MKVRFVRAGWFASLLLAALVLGASAPGRAQSDRILGYFLMLDGEPAGWMYAVDGAGLDADVLPIGVGDDGFLRKRPGAVKYEEIKVTVGAEMSKNFYNWMKDCSTGITGIRRKSGEIIAADFDYKEVRRMAFTNALITEVGFPALDKSSRGNARLFVRFQPDQRVITTSPGGAPIKAPKFRQKQWLCSNFRVTIDGLEKACTRVNKVDAITLKQKVVKENGAETLLYDAGDLALTLPAANSDPLHLWFEASVVKGVSDERSATIEYLNINGATLFTLHLPQIALYAESWVHPGSGQPTPLTDVRCKCCCNSGWIECSVH